MTHRRSVQRRLGSDSPQCFQIAPRGRDTTHVADHGLHDHTRDLVLEFPECFLEGVRVVVGQRESELREFLGHTAEPGMRAWPLLSRLSPGANLHVRDSSPRTSQCSCALDTRLRVTKRWRGPCARHQFRCVDSCRSRPGRTGNLGVPLHSRKCASDSPTGCARRVPSATTL